LGADVGIHQISVLFEAEIPLHPHDLNRCNHISSPQLLNNRVGKRGRMSPAGCHTERPSTHAGLTFYVTPPECFKYFGLSY
jgi:hypothetical protein